MLANEATLRTFCERILGFANDRAVDHAIRSLELAADHRAALVLLGETDLVPIAHALHRRTLGADRPFIVCDRHRKNTPASVRSPTNHETGVAAFREARRGSLCIRRNRLPHDFSSVVAELRSTDDVQLIVCAETCDDAHPFLARPIPIRVPSLRARTDELPRIVKEYAIDAVAELCALRASFTDADRQWVLDNVPLTLPEIEKATLRLVAIRTSRNMSNAAARLGMAPVSLSRWVSRRKRPPPIAHDPEFAPVGAPACEHDHGAHGEENDEPTDLPEGTRLELVSADGVLSNGR
jgi:hypothetical protein